MGRLHAQCLADCKVRGYFELSSPEGHGAAAGADCDGLCCHWAHLELSSSEWDRGLLQAHL